MADQTPPLMSEAQAAQLLAHLKMIYNMLFRILVLLEKQHHDLMR